MHLPFRAKPKSFLDATRREWQFETFAWLLRHCGGYAEFLHSVPVLPIAEHFPDRGMSGHAAVAALFRRVRDHAGMADWPCMVEPHSCDGELRAANASDGIRVIRYDPARCEATLLVAQFARELAAYLIESFEEPPPGGAILLAPATELAAVFMGFGVFIANAVMASTQGALNEGERVHALAMFCLLRRTSPDELDSYLNPHLRKYLRLAAQDLARFDTRFQRLRAVRASRAARVEDTLPASR